MRFCVYVAATRKRGIVSKSRRLFEKYGEAGDITKLAKKEGYPASPKEVTPSQWSKL